MGNGAELALRGGVYRGTASLKEKCPTGLLGTPPTLDVLVEGPEVLAIESKLTEPFRPHEAHFEPAYAEATCRLPGKWREEYARLDRDPFRYRYLDAAQLIKHALGLCTALLGSTRRRDRLPSSRGIRS